MELCDEPLHLHTQALFTAALPAHPGEPRQKLGITGGVASALAPPSGCRFHPRCPMAIAKCVAEAPVTTKPPPPYIDLFVCGRACPGHLRTAAASPVSVGARIKSGQERIGKLNYLNGSAHQARIIAGPRIG
jgi:oligopeptide/dipeptide ABC transporter ATP-binding protein